MLPLAQMVARGKGLLRLPIRVRRRDYCEVELERAKVDMLKSKAAPEGPFASIRWWRGPDLAIDCHPAPPPPTGLNANDWISAP